MDKIPNIKLRGLNGVSRGKNWESQKPAKVGRLENLEIVLDDPSVSRMHGEFFFTPTGWHVRDLGSRNGTLLNGVKLGAGQWPVKTKDLVQFGEVALVVIGVGGLETSEPESDSEGEPYKIEATISAGWEEALLSIGDKAQSGEKGAAAMQALVRAGQYLANVEKPEDLLRKILEDAVETLEAQRGAIALWDTSNNKLQVRAISDGKGAPESVRHGLNTPSTNLVIYSHSMAKQCLEKKESILYQNEDQNIKDRSRSIAEGVMNSILCVHLRTPRKTIGILHLDRGPWQKNFNRDDLQLADALGAQVSAGIECAQLLEKQKRLFLDTVTALAQSVEMRDPYTGGHTQRVTAISLLLAKAAKLTETEIEQIRIGTPLHDIGKIGIDDAILRKPGRLTDEEMENMRSHTTKGAAIVTLIPDLRDILPIVRSHHERYDGKGYPDGLKGENIPRVARAVAIADTFDAMASDRPYRKGLPLEAAFKEIEKFKGVQFDPVLAEIFLTLKGALQVYPNLKIPN